MRNVGTAIICLPAVMDGDSDMVNMGPRAPNISSAPMMDGSCNMVTPTATAAAATNNTAVPEDKTKVHEDLARPPEYVTRAPAIVGVPAAAVRARLFCVTTSRIPKESSQENNVIPIPARLKILQS